jgi:branched-chain amino acid transport system permease protein
LELPVFDFKRLIPGLTFVAAAIALPLGPVQLDRRFFSVAVLAFSVASLSMSWNILGGFAGQISLGHAAFFGIGALITRQMWLDGRPVALSLLAAVAAAGLVSLLIGGPVLRLRGIYFSIATLAVAEAIRITISNTRPGITALSPEALRTYDFSSRYFLALGVLVLTVVASVWLKVSKLGLGMMALREDEGAARATGVNVFGHKLTAFVISASLAALAGGAFGFFHVSYYPSFPFGPQWTFDALVVVFVGGIGTITGPLLGSAFFVLIRDLLAVRLVDFHVIIFGVLFIAIVLLMPGGLVEGGIRLRSMASNAIGATRRRRSN